MKVGFYPGCSLKGSSREYRESLLAIAPRLGVELVELPDWNCCGATAGHNLNPLLAHALPARVLALAEKAGFDELVVPCSACYSRLMNTRHALLRDETLRQRIEDVIDLNCVGATKVLNVLEFLARFAGEAFKANVVEPFAHNVACYYGCYLTRPAALTVCGRAEDPTEMDDLVRAVGGTPVKWAFKVECCGAGLSVSRTTSVAELSARIIEDAAARGAEAIVVACPMCHTNLDLRRDAVERLRQRRFRLPVLYVSQMIGMAFGIDRCALGLHRHNVPVDLRSIPASPATAAAPSAGERPAAN